MRASGRKRVQTATRWPRDMPPSRRSRGATASYSLGLSRQGGYDQAVTFTVEGLPAGVTTQLPAPSSAAGPLSALPQMTVATSATPGSYTLTFRASGAGGMTSSATMTLTVQ